MWYSMRPKAIDKASSQVASCSELEAGYLVFLGHFQRPAKKLRYESCIESVHLRHAILSSDDRLRLTNNMHVRH
jgi:hypothetical protein